MKEMNEYVDQYMQHAPVASPLSLSIPEDELDELMKEMDEYVDQYLQHEPVASPLSPGTAFSLQYTSSHFVVNAEYIFIIALNNVLFAVYIISFCSKSWVCFPHST